MSSTKPTKRHNTRLDILKERHPEAVGTLKDIIARGEYADEMAGIDAQYKKEAAEYNKQMAAWRAQNKDAAEEYADKKTARASKKLKLGARSSGPAPFFEGDMPVCDDLNEMIKLLIIAHRRETHFHEEIRTQMKEVKESSLKLETMVGESRARYVDRTREHDAVMSMLDSIRKIYTKRATASN